MLFASGDSCPVLMKGDKSCRTGQRAGGDEQLLGGPAYLLLGWTGSALSALASWLTLAIRFGTIWHPLVCQASCSPLTWTWPKGCDNVELCSRQIAPIPSSTADFLEKRLFKTKLNSEKAKWESVCSLKGVVLYAMVHCVQSLGKQNKLYAVRFSYLVVKVGVSGF